MVNFGQTSNSRILELSLKNYWQKNTNELSPVNIVIKENNKVNTGHIWQRNFSNKNLAVKDYLLKLLVIKAITKAHRQPKTKTSTWIRLHSKKMPFTKSVNISEKSSFIETKNWQKSNQCGKDLTFIATASEIMNNIPSVNIDQDGKLSLRGNENVRVLVDGRPKYWALRYWKQIHQLPLKKNELITNPVPNTIQKECLWNHKHRFIKTLMTD
jgi:hypothetical protein